MSVTLLVSRMKGCPPLSQLEAFDSIIFMSVTPPVSQPERSKSK